MNMKMIAEKLKVAKPYRIGGELAGILVKLSEEEARFLADSMIEYEKEGDNECQETKKQGMENPETENPETGKPTTKAPDSVPSVKKSKE